jgi:squalene synthase HpnC
VTTRSQVYTPSPSSDPPGLPAVAELLARAGSENFRVASWTLPADVRRHLLAFYGFARLVDEIGDSYRGDRLAALAWVEAETQSALRNPIGRHPLVGGAVESVVELGVDPAPLFDLIEANRRDQIVNAYGTFEDLLAYCALSANPVGRLVLGALRIAGQDVETWSDSICTGLQLVEHWQDVGEDAVAGRVYLPGEDLERFGVEVKDLSGDGPAGRQLRALMVFETARARRMLDAGLPLLERLPWRFRWAVAGFWAGGHSALDALAAADFDVLSRPARPHRATAARLALSALAGSARTTRRDEKVAA